MKRKLALIWIGAGLQALGQPTGGSIGGTVHDVSGHVIERATLTLRNLDENTRVTCETAAQGRYQFVNLKPARYSLAAGKTGFGEKRTPDMILDARQTRRADFTLDIAPHAQVIEVTARVPLVDSSGGTVSSRQGAEALTRLPLNYRASANNSPLTAVAVVPGVQQDDGNRLALGGGLPPQNEISVDGISTVDIQTNSQNYAMTPSAEMLSELRVAAIDNGAEFGQMGNILLVTHGGTNERHGGVDWYYQNRALDARTYGTAVKQAKVFNAFGGHAGGPLEIPGVYSGRNRTFFFADYEGIRRPQTRLLQMSVPALTMHAGDLTGVPGGAAVDPLNRAPFPQNHVPASRISAVTSKLLDQWYPAPNQPAGAAYNDLMLEAAGDRQDGYDVRLDHTLSAAHLVFARWTAKSGDSSNPNNLLPASNYRTSIRNLAASSVYRRGVLSNELRFGISRSRFGERFPLSGFDVANGLGLTGVKAPPPDASGGFPSFQFSDGTGFTGIGHLRSQQAESRLIQITDSLIWIRGGHTARFGADVRRVGYRSTLFSGADCGNEFGCLVFSSGAFSGNAFADLLLGLPATSYYTKLGPNINEFETNSGYFAQDMWRVSRRVTLNFGLRWELHPPFREAAGNLTSFDHQTGDVIIPDGALPAAPSFLAAIHACPLPHQAPGCTRVLSASEAGLPGGLRKTDFRNWNPRFGFAWQPSSDGRTVLRGGVGRYTQSLLGWFAYGPTGIHSSDNRTFQNYQGPDVPARFTLPEISPPLTELGSMASEHFAYGVDPTMKDPHTIQWNVTLERELPIEVLLRTSYIGVAASGLPVAVDFNQVPFSSLRFSPSRQPFPNWANLFSMEGIGFAHYEGLQVQLSRRLQNGVFFQASYTLSKDLGETGSVGGTLLPSEFPQTPVTDRFNTRYDRGDLGGVRRNRVVLTGILPLASGAGWRGWRRGAFGGWELSTITMVQSGPYQTPTIRAAQDQSNTDVPGRGVPARPDRVGDGNLPNPTPQRYYDVTAFAAVPGGAGRFGNAGAGILKGPGTVAIAGGIGKTVRIGEVTRLRIEATFTNLPNHPNLLAPSAVVTNPRFGVLTTAQSSQNSGNRTGQVGMRLEF